MKRAIFFIVVASVLLSSAVRAQDGAATESAQGQLIVDALKYCRAPLDEFTKAIRIERGKFSVESTADPAWGTDQWWSLSDPDELKRFGLKSLIVSIEQGKFRAVYFVPSDSSLEDTGGNENKLDRNLRYMGITRDDIETHEWGAMRWYTASDRNGFPINIRVDGLQIECFEHHAGH